MINENKEELKYVIKVNGQIRTVPLLKQLAEDALQNLPESEREIAELVAVTAAGKELLLG